MISVNVNSAASGAGLNLGKSNDALQKSLARLSSGRRIVTSSDDAGGLAVSMKMNAALRRTESTSISLRNVDSFLQTQDSAMETAGKVLARISELCAMAQDVTKNDGDVDNYFTELKALYAELGSIATEKFNGIPLFDNQASSATSFNCVKFLTVPTTEDGSQTSTVSIPPLLALNPWTTKVEGVFPDPDGDNDFPGEDIDTEIQHGLEASLTYRDFMRSFGTMSQMALEIMADWRAQNGAEQSRIGFAQDMLQKNSINLEASNSRIIDVDVAAESSQLARFQILQQAGTAMLAQANTSQQALLKLLQG